MAIIIPTMYDMPTTQSVWGVLSIIKSTTGDRVDQLITLVRLAPSPIEIPHACSIMLSGSIIKNWLHHIRYRQYIGSPRPSACLMCSLISGGTVIGSCAVGSPGDKSNSKNITKLINKRTGIVKINRLIVYFNIAVSQFSSLRSLTLLPLSIDRGSKKMIFLFTVPISNVPKFAIPCVLPNST